MIKIMNLEHYIWQLKSRNFEQSCACLITVKVKSKDMSAPLKDHPSHHGTFLYNFDETKYLGLIFSR